MMDLSKIPEEEKSPLVNELLRVILQMANQLEQQREEIARLKNHNGKPKIPPSQLEKDPQGHERRTDSKGKRPGSAKRSKTQGLIIHETRSIPPKHIPPGSTLAGHDKWIVQGLTIQLHNICYKLERWITQEGKLIRGILPDSVDGHFDAALRSFILQQHHHGGVTQPLLWEELRDIGIDISKGQVSRILTENKSAFHTEKADILSTGLDVSAYINVDDTGARHAGENGYCTHIGNELFAWFESTASKSRINFLRLLNTGLGYSDYIVNDAALKYIKEQSFPQALLTHLATSDDKHFENEGDWENHLNQLAITKERHVRIATQGALIGSILHHGFKKELVILSDDAGQFDVFLHALCWIHAERTIHKLIPCNKKESEAINNIRDRIWELYRKLKTYKENPDEEAKLNLEKRFDDIFTTQTCCKVLNDALLRVANNKDELLLVLDRPDIPLHNNLSERDIREYVKKRKISGSTRSDEGRRCRDTFASLKKTCRKLEVPFWEYLHDRISKTNKIPSLPNLIRSRAESALS